ncbi:urea transporter [Shewanella sp. SNU WT4]|uniref:urea transporter n=1 Tax=Shewanella sp. SNU WT4 TaxID=2590015 RepID=UPI0011293A1F|nr:urea transporter [Shewanella sp. SNU WT4]QDF66109.1 urea transporter [Shewanella sp. SNU WT4]
MSRDFYTTTLVSVSQIFFIKQPVTGLLFLLAISYNAWLNHHWLLLFGALIATLVANSYAHFRRFDGDMIISGLYGFNGALTGLALTTFLQPSQTLWGYLILSAIVSTELTALFTRSLRPLAIAASTGPFVLTTWLALLLIDGLHLIPAITPAITGGSVADTITQISMSQLMAACISTLFNNIAQVMLLNNPISGAMIWLGILLADKRAALLLAFNVTGITPAMTSGLLGFSCVLTAMAIGQVFYIPSWRQSLWSLVALLMTFGLVMTAELWFKSSLPLLTAPYVITLYLFGLIHFLWQKFRRFSPKS